MVRGTFVKAPDISRELNRIISFSRVLQLKGLTGYTGCAASKRRQAMPQRGNALAVLALRWIWLGMRRRHQSFTIDPFSDSVGRTDVEAARQAEAAGQAFSNIRPVRKAWNWIKGCRADRTIGAVNADAGLEKILSLPLRKSVDCFAITVFPLQENHPLSISWAITVRYLFLPFATSGMSRCG